ncbi:MAG TPA: hypothetical protein VIK18_27305 [Pirellulales bacterium]
MSVVRPAPAAPAAEDVTAAAAQLTAAYRTRLEALAKWCDEHKLAEQAARTRDWLRRPQPVTLEIPILPSSPDWNPPAGASPEVREWCGRFRQLREERGQELFELAKQALSGHRPTLAFELLTSAVRENPDHAEGRRILGYEQFGGGWRTPYEATQARARKVWHDKYGWLLAERVARYEAGERYELGHWSPAADSARRHGDIVHGWDIETEHYHVRTDHSLEEGVRLAARLERLYRAWQQLFVAYYVSEAELRRAFAGGTIEPRRRVRHQVTYFRNRDEYVAEMQKIDPRVGMTTGYYYPPQRKAFFFVPAEPDDSTVYHEATHQLFGEMRPVVPLPGREANAWVLEGVACFMESLVERDGFCVLGGVNAVRLSGARQRLLVDSFYVPLAELVGLSMERLQSDQRIRGLYTEASGLTYFLVFDGQGRFRDTLVAYLVAIYTGRDRTGTLAQLTGSDYSRLDAEYRAFVQSTATGRSD